MSNFLTLTDSYKFSHWKQYPPGTEHVYSYFESRTGSKFPETVFFGLQYLLKKYLEGRVATKEDVAMAKGLVDVHIAPGTFNEAGWLHIVNDHGGRLPVRIRAVPEGTPVPVSNALMTLENTCPKCYWVTNYLETLLVQTWYPSTVATQSRVMKEIIIHYLRKTGDPEDHLFKLHDFGFRGSTSVESAGLGGMAHLVNFRGTDTVRGVEFAGKYYGTKAEPLAGFSIHASEHSTITAWGKEGEVDAMRNMLESYPTGLMACVSDSWNVYNAAEKIWGETLKEAVMARDGTLVVRPDSGDPIEVVPKVMAILADKFGSVKNDKGFRVLDKHVRMIQGDGITVESIEQILEAVAKAGFSTDNLTFGSGGGLLQKLDRDTQKFAFKACAVKVNGEWRDVWKDPATDPGKTSKKGRLGLYVYNNKYTTSVAPGPNEEAPGRDAMETVFEDGEIKKTYTFDEVRENAKV